MKKYYLFALIKAILLIFLTFLWIKIIGFWDFSYKYRFWIVVLSFLYFFIQIPTEREVEEIEEEWDWIRITQNRRWYERYLNGEIRKKLKK